MYVQGWYNKIGKTVQYRAIILKYEALKLQYVKLYNAPNEMFADFSDKSDVAQIKINLFIFLHCMKYKAFATVNIKFSSYFPWSSSTYILP